MLFSINPKITNYILYAYQTGLKTAHSLWIEMVPERNAARCGGSAKRETSERSNGNKNVNEQTGDEMWASASILRHFFFFWRNVLRFVNFFSLFFGHCFTAVRFVRAPNDGEMVAMVMMIWCQKPSDKTTTWIRNVVFARLISFLLFSDFNLIF